MSMLCRPMYESHDMRHIGFPQVDGGQWDPWEMGRHIIYLGHSLVSWISKK